MMDNHNGWKLLWSQPLMEPPVPNHLLVGGNKTEITLAMVNCWSINHHQHIAFTIEADPLKEIQTLRKERYMVHPTLDSRNAVALRNPFQISTNHLRDNTVEAHMGFSPKEDTQEHRNRGWQSKYLLFFPLSYNLEPPEEVGLIVNSSLDLNRSHSLHHGFGRPGNKL